MLVTTTDSFDGYTIKEYKGIFFGEVINGIDFTKDFMASFSNFFGGRSGAYEEELMKARTAAVEELEKRCREASANGIVGIKVDVEVIGTNNANMLMVTATGTGVVLERVR